MATPNETAFFEDLRRSLDTWLDAAVTGMTEPSADLRWASSPEAFRLVSTRLSTPEARAAVRSALDQVLQGLLHSVLVTFDAGTTLTEHTTLTITDSSGQMFSDGLHELFYEHLAAKDRLA